LESWIKIIWKCIELSLSFFLFSGRE
jgi:hypothetical protein